MKPAPFLKQPAASCVIDFPSRGISSSLGLDHELAVGVARQAVRTREIVIDSAIWARPEAPVIVFASFLGRRCLVHVTVHRNRAGWRRRNFLNVNRRSCGSTRAAENAVLETTLSHSSAAGPFTAPVAQVGLKIFPVNALIITSAAAAAATPPPTRPTRPNMKHSHRFDPVGRDSGLIVVQKGSLVEDFHALGLEVSESLPNLQFEQPHLSAVHTGMASLREMAW